MEEQLILIAAAESEVLRALGSGRRDAAAGEAWWRRAVALGAPELAPEDDGIELAARTLLFGPSEQLPLDGGPDGYWQALATFAVLASWDAVQVPGLRALHDVDAALREAAVAPPRGLVAASRYPAAGLPEALDVDVRVVPADVATASARAWLDATPDLDGAAAMTRFCRSYLGLAAEAAAVGRPAPDWFAVAPACVALPRPFARLPWPLPALREPRVHPDAHALVVELTGDFPGAGELSDVAQWETRFEPVDGLYVRSGWRLEWRVADGLVRATDPSGRGAARASFGRLSGAWGRDFDAALAATPFPRSPAGCDPVATLTLRSASVGIPGDAGGAWLRVLVLLDGVLATLAPGSVAAAAEPDWVLPL